MTCSKLLQDLRGMKSFFVVILKSSKIKDALRRSGRLLSLQTPLDGLKIERNGKERAPSAGVEKNDDSTGVSYPRSEYYETYEEDTPFSRHDVGSRPTPITIPTTFNLTHRLDTCPKIQHFSKQFVVFAQNHEGKEAGQITGRYINLPLIKKSMAKSKATFQSNFYTRMQALNIGSSDGPAFAKDLFCPNGKLKKEPMSYNNGPWGSELETGAVLVLQLVFIEKDFRRQGLASSLLQFAINKTKERVQRTEDGRVKFVVVFPAVVKEDFGEELEGETEEKKKEIEKWNYDRAVKFYRSVGFRRIGLSKWFGLALDPEHLSRQVPVWDDLNSPEYSNAGTS